MNTVLYLVQDQFDSRLDTSLLVENGTREGPIKGRNGAYVVISLLNNK